MRSVVKSAKLLVEASMEQNNLMSEPTIEASPPLSHFWDKFKRYSFQDKWMTTWGVLRFLLNAHKFESKEPIVIGKKAVIVNRGKTGRLIAERGVRIARGCVIVVGERGLLSLGTRTVIGPNTRIMAATQVRIGARCMISWNCSIFDSIGHRMWLQGQDEAEIETPVTIGDDVWIGPYTIIMKGVEIGSNSIIGAGSVVRRSMPPNSLAYGNPARVVGKVDRWER
jgi:acetyltransferase-like isoleucine patch superfamily enzyme